MQIDPGYLTVLRERYRFAEWSEPAGDSDVVQGIESFRGNELPGWTLRRGTRTSPYEDVTLVRGIWSSTRAGTKVDERALDVELFICKTPAAARELLLSVLGDMQGPPASRLPPGSIGDVAFHLGGDSAIMFARANLVARVRNAGRVVSGVMTEASVIDALLERRMSGK
ncbi:MAG: hypothetical protein ACT4P7_22085 [Gemmatimonadaceae bacterium]